jgi:hypothetical protein
MEIVRRGTFFVGVLIYLMMVGITVVVGAFWAWYVTSVMFGIPGP